MKTIINYALTLLLWVAAIVIWAALSFPYLFLFLLALHIIELLIIGFRTGKEYGISAGKSILMCMLFGYNWWLPLRRQMKAETFTDLDFVREV
jgi:hypothetical protein